MAKKHGMMFIGEEHSCCFVKDQDIYMTGKLLNDVYQLDFTVILPHITSCYAVSYGNIPMSEQRASIQKWHNRLGHVHYDMIRKMARSRSVSGLTLSTKDLEGIYPGCQFGKKHRSTFPTNIHRTRATYLGALIHGDICGPMSVQSKGGALYFILFKDDYSSFRFVFCIRHKSDALECFQRVFKTILRDTGNTISILQTDRGGEFTNKVFDKFLADNFIKRELTAPYTLEQNAVVERDNRTVMEGVRSSIYQAKIDVSFWTEAVIYIVYTLNRTGTRLLGNYTPYELFTGNKPSVSHMKPFGCPVYFMIPDKLRKKLEPKVRTGIFLGYSDETKGYRVWDNQKTQVVISHDITFDEEKLILSSYSMSSSSSLPIKPLSFVPSFVLEDPPQRESHIARLQPNLPSDTPPDPDQPQLPHLQTGASTSSATLNAILPSDNRNSESIAQTRPARLLHQETGISTSSATPTAPLTESTRPARHRNQPQRYGEWFYSFSAMAGTLPPVPKTVAEALASPYRKKWMDAMDSEYGSLLANETWTAVSLPPGRKPIKCKWIFALKTKPDGSIERFKDRLVAKGCSQQPGVDFKETFSPTVKYDSIRIILAIVAAQDLHMKQFNIQTAFLYGTVKEELYMQQIEGYEDKDHPEWVYLLLKALYSLRQASRAWHDKIAGFLKKYELQQADVDPCVYYSSAQGIITIVCIFVDDGLICSSSEDRITSILKFMNDVFVTKVSEPSIYVGLHIKRDWFSRTISIDQALYIQKKIVEQYNLTDAQPMKTPADPNSKLSRASNSSVENFDTKFPYSNMVGTLQFAAITTRRDVSYATSAVAAYKNHPTQAHCNAVKRIAKYLKGTQHFKIRLGGTKQNGVLSAYTDADFAADSDDRKSRTGYVIYYNNGPIAWGSKKQSCVATSTTHA
jgi:hypothetical protein